MANKNDFARKNEPIAEKRALRADELDKAQREEDEKFMARCLQLARQGRTGARPNPMVGAVVVHQGRIIGEGFHTCQGGPHAEVNALASVQQPELLPESTIYVSLEPCAHHGKTPPCADLIVSRRLRRCVIGCQDPFAKVDGLGIQKLLDAGINVTIGILEKECLALNRTFVTFHTKRRPFITLKWAQSADGFLDARQNASARDCKAVGTPTTFSTPLTLSLMHRLRTQSDAILVGGGTILADNPSLTARHWATRGETGNLPALLREQKNDCKGQPLRVVIDTHGDLPADKKIFNSEAETLTWHDWNLPALLDELFARQIQTLLVEGGTSTLQRFLDAGLWDELRVETAPFSLASGTNAPSLPSCARLVRTYKVGTNTIAFYEPRELPAANDRHA